MHPGRAKDPGRGGARVGTGRRRAGGVPSGLAEHGNCSSPTVLMILERLIGSVLRPVAVMLAFGPGLTLYAALLELALGGLCGAPPIGRDATVGADRAARVRRGTPRSRVPAGSTRRHRGAGCATSTTPRVPGVGREVRLVPQPVGRVGERRAPFRRRGRRQRRGTRRVRGDRDHGHAGRGGGARRGDRGRAVAALHAAGSRPAGGCAAAPAAPCGVDEHEGGQVRAASGSGTLVVATSCPAGGPESAVWAALPRSPREADQGGDHGDQPARRGSPGGCRRPRLLACRRSSASRTCAQADCGECRRIRGDHVASSSSSEASSG